jgi:hypothetical protein
MSTLAPNVERWWVDLNKYNENNIPDRVHRDILEVPSLRNFINSEIKNSTFSDSENIVVNNTSTLISDGSRLHFTLHSPLTLGITDGEGRYTGMDPVTKEIKEEIPNVYYRHIGEVQFLSVPFGTPYTLKLQGYAEGSFSLDVDKQTGDTVTDSFLFEGIHSFISTLATMDIGTSFNVSDSKLKVDENGDGSIDKIYPIVTEPSAVPVAVSRGGGIFPAVIQTDNQTNSESKNNIKEKWKDNGFIMQGLEEIGSNPFPAVLNIKAKEPSQYAGIASFLEGKNSSQNGADIVDKINYNQNKLIIERLGRIMTCGSSS